MKTTKQWIETIMAMPQDEVARLPIHIPIPLKNDRVAVVILPRDITESEAKRVSKIVDTFGLPDADNQAIQP